MANKRLLKILFVEDIPSDAELAIRELRKDGLQFDHRRVDIRVDFINALNDFNPDIIISDYKMPSYDGMQALLDAKEFNPQIPFILFTGSINEETAVKCIQAGADDYIIKEHLTRLPYAVKEVLEKNLKEKEKKAAELLLKENEEKLQSIFRAAPVGIGLVVNRIFMEINDTFCTMTGYTRKELIGKGAEMIYSTNEEFESAGIDKYGQISEKGTGSVETRFKCKDGKIIYVLLSSTPLDQNDRLKGVTFTVMDITERKRAEEALTESETKYRQLVTQSPDGIFIIDLSGKFISVNKAICEGLSYTEEELLSINMLDIIPEQYHALLKQRLLNIMKGESTNMNADYEVKGKNGISYFLEVLSVPYYKGKEIIGFQGIARDITVRKNAEKALEQSELRFKQLSENSVEWIWEIDKNGLYTFSSPIVKEILGYEPEEIVDKRHFYDFFNPPVREQLKEAAFGVFALRESFKNFSNSNLHKDGREVMLSTSGIPMFDSEGNYIGYRGVDTDITERKRTEEALRESEEKFRSIMENSADAIFITDQMGRYVFTNKAVTDMLGYTSEEMKKMTILDITPKNESVRYLEIFNKILAEGKVYAEIELLKKDGNFISTDLNSVLLPGGTVYGSCRDITERKLTDEALKHAKEKAEASDKLKTSFLNNISHEVRTPLNGILGFAEIMSQIDISEEERRVSLSMLYESSDRLLDTITNYMDISLINSGTMSVYKKNVLPEQILRELYAKKVIICSARNLELYLEMPERSEKMVICSDSEILRKILTHLLNNAIKFTEKGSIKYGFTVHKAELEFFVKDTGIGIGKESLESVFERFVKEDRGPLRISEGSGLGLSISKGLAELLGGKLMVESEKGTGSTFFFTVPVEKEIENNILRPVERKQKENKKTWSILVAEDDLVNFFYLRTLLKQHLSAEIIHASNGKEAVDKFLQNPHIDIILMDIKMPVMDGLEATRQIKAVNQNIPIIAITAYAMAGDESRILDAGCDFYLIKPINKKLLLDKMAEYIEI